ncbi:hypothetical protein MUN84_14050 [Hymenobacter sp. 5516J-16]|uniref:hypothetical protein n=1 Tax=Hymenobacter sp. 5516J-16 TaxID=2932253 RepID=UPI001FD62319|nr:hypothetical protein [Hymenobacter sp. 5516J-16]UOQ75769.1 hypothetical protein MUN84_14050 [Hymenobacter sp. 5516J-16]
MKQAPYFALVAVVLSFTACDGQKEGTTQPVDTTASSGDAQLDAMEERANAVRDSADAKAAALESPTDSVPIESAN